MQGAVPTADVNNVDAQLKRLRHALAAMTLVVAVGTGGFMIIQDQWGFWRSLYFTLITITTVGYTDYGLSPAGERFTSFLLVFGIGTATYAFGQIVQVAVAYQLSWRRRMQRTIDQLEDHFVVCGMGRVGRVICERLAEAETPFVVVDRNDERIERARSLGYLVVTGTCTDDRTLLAAGIKRAKGMVCAAQLDADNIVTTLSARELNPSIQIVSRANEEDAVHKFQRAGASQIVAPEVNGGHEMAGFLLHPHLVGFLQQSNRQSDPVCVMTEIFIRNGSPLVNKSLREYGKEEPSIVFVAIKRGSDETIVRPVAKFSFQPGDIVITAGDPTAVSRMSVLARKAPRRTSPKKELTVAAG